MEAKVREEPSGEESNPSITILWTSSRYHQGLQFWFGVDFSFSFCSYLFILDVEVARLLFKFHLEDAPFSKEQQDQVPEFNIWPPRVLSPSMIKTLGFVINWPTQVLTMTRQAYVSACTGPFHDNFKVRLEKRLDTWLRYGIIRLSKSLYASEVFIVRKKTGEIWLFVHYQKLNSVVARNAFPLPL